MGVVAIAVVGASSGAALAASGGYAINMISGPKTVEQKGKFTITVTGHAQKQSALSIYLDYRKCPGSEIKESKRDGYYKTGYSYFPGPTPFTGFQVQGAFSKSATGHAGGITGRRYVCAYLTITGGDLKTQAHGSASYKVTK